MSRAAPSLVTDFRGASRMLVDATAGMTNIVAAQGLSSSVPSLKFRAAMTGIPTPQFQRFTAGY
jgi:hypothetical protein